MKEKRTEMVKTGASFNTVFLYRGLDVISVFSVGRIQDYMEGFFAGKNVSLFCTHIMERGMSTINIGLENMDRQC